MINLGKYTSMPCAHCENKFVDKDDVVVCPICGAPHHRSCYREKGSCALEDQHSEEFVWQAPFDPELAKKMITCKKCGTQNLKEATFCNHCGTNIKTGGDPDHPRDNSTAYSNVPVNVGEVPPSSNDGFEVGGITAREISAYVGSSSFFFLRQFQFLLSTKFNFSWNWPAFFFKFAYLFYRKMYALGTTVMALYALLSIPSVLYSVELLKQMAPDYLGVTMAYNVELMAEMEKYMPMCTLGLTLLSIFCGAFTNKVYLRKVITDITKLRNDAGAKPAGSREYYAELYMRGKTNKIAVILIIAGGFLLYSALGSYIIELAGIM